MMMAGAMWITLMSLVQANEANGVASEVIGRSLWISCLQYWRGGVGETARWRQPNRARAVRLAAASEWAVAPATGAVNFSTGCSHRAVGDEKMSETNWSFW